MRGSRKFIGWALLVGAILAPEGAGAFTSSNVDAASAPSPTHGRCYTRQLTIAPLQTSAGMGHVGTMFRLHNRSHITCYLMGYPGAQLLDTNGRALATHLIRDLGYLAGSRPRRLVQLSSGGNAYFLLEWEHFPSPGQSCPTARYLRIIPPDAYTSLLVSMSHGGIDACGGILHSTPVEPTRFSL